MPHTILVAYAISREPASARVTSDATCHV